jgi:hypothetical protein
MKSKRMTIALAAAGICLLTACLFLYMGKDRKAPEIQFDGNRVGYREGEDETILLSGARAVDDRDGDVSDTLTVSSIYPLADGKTAKVYYAASDKAGNIGKECRIVDYQAAAETGKTEDETKTEPQTEPVSEPTEPEPTEPEPTAGEPEPTEGETEPTEPEPANPEAPVLTLSQAEVAIGRGQNFYFGSYIASITDDKDSQDDLFRRLHVEGDYDVNAPGTYPIRIFAVDSDGNHSNEVVLTLIVS